MKKRRTIVDPFIMQIYQMGNSRQSDFFYMVLNALIVEVIEIKPVEWIRANLAEVGVPFAAGISETPNKRRVA